MRLQKNTLLALYSVIEFAADPARHISAAEIAEKYGVSPHHLAKVLAELARARVVESVRGVGGGYRFAGNARRLTLMDIIQIFEDFEPHAGAWRQPTGPMPVTAGAASFADAIDSTTARPADLALGAVLSEIDEIARATFSSITLATMLGMIGRQQEKAIRGTAPMKSEPAARGPRSAASRRREVE